MTALLIYIIIVLVAIISATFVEFHKLRIKRMNELYEFSPEAYCEHIFKIIYDLHKEGQSLTNTEIRQKWDEKVLAALKKYFKNICLNDYLMRTRRIMNHLAMPS